MKISKKVKIIPDEIVNQNSLTYKGDKLVTIIDSFTRNGQKVNFLPNSKFFLKAMKDCMYDLTHKGKKEEGDKTESMSSIIEILDNLNNFFQDVVELTNDADIQNDYFIHIKEEIDEKQDM